LATVVGDHADLVGRQPQRLGGDLAQRQVRSLPDIGRAHPYMRVLNRRAADQFDCGGGLLGVAERVADVFDAAGDTPAAPQMRTS